MKYVYSVELETFYLEKDSQVWKSANRNTCAITSSFIKARQWMVARDITFLNGWKRSKIYPPEFEKITLKLDAGNIKQVYRIKRWEL